MSRTTLRHEALTLAAYHEALGELSPFRWSRRLLLEQLGDVDRQAAHPVPDARLALAGRLIAAAQVAERVRLPEPQVQAIVRAWLSNDEAERDGAAPVLDPRGAPDEERIEGFTRKLSDSETEGGFSRAAWGIAGTVLRQLIQPAVEVSRALGLRDTLRPLAGSALALSDDPPPPRVTGDAPICVLTATVLRLRSDGRIVTDPARDHHEQSQAWLRIAGDATRAHACWAQAPIERSMEQAVGRATDRLATSLVPDEPDRFDHEAAVEYAVQAAFDAAVTALGLTAQPGDPIFARGKQDVLKTLLEAASSGLVGAWVAGRAGR